MQKTENRSVERAERTEKTEKREICYIGSDYSRKYLVMMEVMHLGIPFRQTDSWPSPEQGDVWVADLDDIALLATFPEDCPPLIGISSREADLPDQIRTRCECLLHRPFSCCELRRCLQQKVAVFPGVGGEVVSFSPERVVRKTERGDALPPLRLRHTTLFCGERKISLTTNEVALMECLLGHRGQVVSKETLQACMKEKAMAGSKSNRLEVYICYLRRKLEQPTGLRYIRTVRGVGYCLEKDERQ